MAIQEIHQPSMLSVISLLLTASAAAWTDWKEWRVPNQLLAASATAAIMFAVFSLGGMGFAECLLGGLVGMAVFMPIYLLGGMGAGDVKLMGSLGMHAGWLLTLEIAIASALVGGLFAVVIFVMRSEPAAWLRLKCREMLGMTMSSNTPSVKVRNHPPVMKAGSEGTLPYAVVIAIGTGLVIGARFMA